MNTIHYLSILLFLALPACPITAQTSPKQLPPPLYLIFENGKYGYMDSTGKVRIQPVFASADHFSEGLAAVRKNGRYGYIDIQGQFHIQPIFDYAEAFENGEAEVWLDGKGFSIDKTGKRTTLETNKQERPDLDIDYALSEQLDKEAKSLGYTEITPVHDGRRFAEENSQVWYLTDSSGKKISETPFEEVLGVDSGPLQWEEIWADGLAFVETIDGFGAIDRDGNFKIPVREFEFGVEYVVRYGDYLLLGEDISVENEQYSYKYGYWNWKTNFLLEPKFYRIRETDLLHSGLIGALEGKQWCYITPEGKYIWKERVATPKMLPALNIDFMMRGNFYAASPYSNKYNGFGGWGRSDNYAHKITKAQSPFESNKIQLKANPQKKKIAYGKSRGFALYLANTTPDTIVLNAEDSRLKMLIQAQDSAGAWRDITYLPSSWCGNSYHQVFLAPGEYWNFIVPVMDGEFRTKMRVLLKAPQGDGTDIISNEYEGGVNPAQFWRQDGYTPASIMDPYND